MEFSTGWEITTDDSMYSLNSSQYSSAAFSAALEALPVESSGSPFIGSEDSTFPYSPFTFPVNELSCVPVTPPATSRASPSPTVSSSHSRKRGSVPEDTSTTKRAKTSPHNAVPCSLSEPATVLCEAWLENYPSIFPKTKHIRALTDLTDESGKNIERWLSQRMRQSPAQTCQNAHQFRDLPLMPTPPRYGASPNLPTISLPYLPSVAAESSPAESTPTPDLPALRAAALEEASQTLSSSTASVGRHCVPTTSPDLLKRDTSKPFQCTHKCGARFAQRDDWRKHEERRAPQEGWLCLVPFCTSSTLTPTSNKCRGEPAESKPDDTSDGKSAFCARPSYRRQHFRQHFKRLHPHLAGQMGEYEELGYFKVERAFEERCGFCSTRVRGWREWVAHVGKHFQEGVEVRKWRECEKGELWDV